MTHPQSLARVKQGIRRTGRWASLVAGAFCLWATPHVLRAQAAPLPKAETILDQYIEAAGGRAAHEKIRNRVTRARLEHVGMGIEDKVVLYEAAPNKRFFVVESEALGTTKNGTNGDIVWYLAEQTGPLVETGEARAAGLESAAFDLLLGWRTHFKQVECAGIETIDGRECYKVDMIPIHGEPQTRYFDRQSHLLLRSITTRLSSYMRSIKYEISFDDYKPVDGVMIAHRFTQRFELCGGMREMRFVIDSVEHNVELPADRFDPPAAIVEQARKIAEGKVEIPAEPRGCEKPGEAEPAGGVQPGCKPKAEPGTGADDPD